MSVDKAQFDTDDSIFVNRGHNERVRGMLGAFRDPFSDFGTHALEGPDERHDRRERNRRSDTRDIVPRDMFHGMFRDLNSMVNNMQRNFVSNISGIR